MSTHRGWLKQVQAALTSLSALLCHGSSPPLPSANWFFSATWKLADMWSIEGIPAGGMKADGQPLIWLGVKSGRWEGNGSEPRVSILGQATESLCKNPLVGLALTHALCLSSLDVILTYNTCWNSFFFLNTLNTICTPTNLFLKHFLYRHKKIFKKLKKAFTLGWSCCINFLKKNRDKVKWKQRIYKNKHEACDQRVHWSFCFTGETFFFLHI